MEMRPRKRLGHAFGHRVYIYIYVYTYMYICVYIYICMYMYVYVFLGFIGLNKKCVCIYIQPKKVWGFEHSRRCTCSGPAVKAHTGLRKAPQSVASPWHPLALRVGEMGGGTWAVGNFEDQDKPKDEEKKAEEPKCLGRQKAEHRLYVGAPLENSSSNRCL